MRTRFALVILVTAAASMSTLAQDIGDIVFTDEDADEIRVIPGAGGAPVTLLPFDPSARLAGILPGPDGAYFVTNGPLPIGDSSEASLLRVEDLFGTPILTTVAAGTSIQNPIGLAFHPLMNNMLVVNNPGGGLVVDRFEGILGINIGTGAVTELFEERFPPDPPEAAGYRAGAHIFADPNSNDFFVTTVEGGKFRPATPNGMGSTLQRLSVLPDLSSEIELVVDFSDTEPRLTFVRGITAKPGTHDLYITDTAPDTAGIYKVALDDQGQFQSLTPVLTAADKPEILSTGSPLIYDGLTDTLVFDIPNERKMYRVNLDGTGLTLLAEDVKPRGYAIVPEPSTLVLMGLAGLWAVCRRFDANQCLCAIPRRRHSGRPR